MPIRERENTCTIHDCSLAFPDGTTKLRVYVYSRGYYFCVATLQREVAYEQLHADMKFMRVEKEFIDGNVYSVHVKPSRKVIKQLGE